MLEFFEVDEFIMPRRTFTLFPTDAFRDPTYLDTVKAAVPKVYPVISYKPLSTIVLYQHLYIIT